MIWSEWRGHLAMITGAPYADILEHVIDRFEPPLALTALQNCVKQAKGDGAVVYLRGLSEQRTSSLATSMGLVESSGKPHAVEYPIYFRLCDRYSGDAYRIFRAQFHTVLRHQAQCSLHDFSLDVQYQDVLAIDFCLSRVFKTLRPLSSTASVAELAAAIRQTVPEYQHELKRQRDGIREAKSQDSAEIEKLQRRIDRIEVHLQRTLELLEGNRVLGKRKRDPGRPKSTSSKTTSCRSDVTRALSLFPATNNRLPPQIDIHDNGRLPEDELESEGSFVHRKRLSGDESGDPAGPRLKLRHQAPFANRVVQQSLERTDLTRVQNDTLVSAADYHRLSPTTLARAMFWLYHAGNAEFVLGWLLATTGLPIERLRNTVLCSDLFTGESPHYDMERGILQYKILDGATPVESGKNRVVPLYLPAPLPRLITQIVHDGTTDEVKEFLPFALARKAASIQLKNRFADTPGPPVTLRALRASALERLLPEAQDEVEALLITGQLGNYHSAADAYRSSSVSEVNDLYRAVCCRLAEHVQAREPGLRFVHEIHRARPPSIGTNYLIGSRRAIGSEKWQALFAKIRGEAVSAKLDADIAPGASEEKLARLVDLYQHVAAYAFLGWSLATAARPTSPYSTVLLQDGLGFVVDKSTKAHLERREVPVVEVVNHQVAYAWILFEEVVELAEGLGSVRVHLQHRPDRVQLPPWIRLNRLGFWVDDMRMKYVRAWSTERSYVLHRWPINTARHSAVAMLRGQVSTVALDALLGHSRGRRDAVSTWSGLSLTEVFDELRPAIKAMLADVGYRSMQVGKHV